MKQTWAAPERNKRPILEVLSRVLPASGTVLEVASGTGQHAVFFASELPQLTFQPSDADPQNIHSIAAWVRDANLDNLRPPILLDVTTDDWGLSHADALFNANMIHIAPWEAALSLFRGASSLLKTEAPLILYGPFRLHGRHTADSNEQFDQSLRERDERWGVRDLEAVVEVAFENGFELSERIEMPANNQSVVFRKRS